MFSPTDFLESMRVETAICKHLFSKLPGEGLDYRPDELQRSTLELLQYLTRCAVIPTECMLAGDFSQARDRVEATREMPANHFPDEMDIQMGMMERILGEIPLEDFSTRVVPLPGKRQSPLGPALVNFPLKFITAYRMQLFLYLKACGANDLKTVNCWFGVDTMEAS